jgi:iron complex outermembrane receptor protein
MGNEFKVRPSRARRALPGASLLVAASVCTAQVAPPVAAPLPPVTVTATRIDTPAFDVPASIDRVGSEVIRDGRAQVNISESLGAVPGLQARDRQNYAQDVQISVRGFGARSTFGIRGLRLYVDGIPATFPDGQGQITNVDLGSVDRIEVLRGPYSALYGNSSGGVISVFTEEGAAKPAIDFSLLAGSNGELRLGTKLSGSTGQGAGSFGYVLSGSHFKTDGYRDHSAADRNIGNAKLVYRLDESSSLTVIANSVSLPMAQDPLGLSRAQFEANPRAVDPSALQFNTRKTVSQTQGGLIYERRLDSANTLRALVYDGHRATEQFQSIPVATQSNPLHPGGVIDLSSDYSGTDLRWTNRGMLANAPYSVVLGVTYDTLDQHRLGYLNFTGSGASAVTGVKGALRRDENDTVKSFDQYLQAEWQLTPAWSVSAGLRHSSVHFVSDDHYIVGNNGDDSGSANYGATLPVLGVMFAVNERLHLYATAGRGFETPTLNELAYQPSGAPGLNFSLQPARSDNLEVGAKTRFEGIGDLNIALFDTQTQHEIVTLTNVGGRSTYQNAGATRRTGIEVGWSNTYAENLHAQAAFSLVEATYRDAFKTCNVTPCAAAAQQTVPAGNAIPGVARTGLFASLSWATPLGWQTGIEGRYTSKVWVNDANSDAAGGYAVLGAHVAYVAVLGPWKLTGLLRSDNLLDRRYAGSVIVNEGNSRFFEPAPGRTWAAGASATLTF